MADEALIRALVARACATIAAHKDELTELDQAVGDGDHGLNMARGFAAIAEAEGELAGLTLAAALKKAGMTLVMKVGGASGPLYGTALMEMAKAAEGGEGPLAARLAAAALAGVKARGKSDVGMKTMIETLAPVAEALAAGGGAAEARAAADRGCAATKAMAALKGRAAFLGERAKGHLDPGARSSQLLVHAVCDAVEDAA
jgi:dihydroxyacetone kinase, phosphoprotein-dependent, L subunit